KRLPGKVMKEIDGFPLFVLAAQRVHSEETPVTVLTSNRPDDDIIETTARRYGLACFRGDLDNVLGRFFEAAKSLPEDSIIVRLTADNILPDRQFVGLVLKSYAELNAEYLITDFNHLPYGLSVEVFRKSHLSEAWTKAQDAFDRE